MEIGDWIRAGNLYLAFDETIHGKTCFAQIKEITDEKLVCLVQYIGCGVETYDTILDTSILVLKKEYGTPYDQL